MLLISCHNLQKNAEDQLIAFDLKELPKMATLKLSDLGVIDIEYIPLETKEDCMIQMINNVLVGNDYYLIQYFSKIFKFQFDGSFVTKIGTEGRGPNEFTVVHDLDIDPKTQHIYLADGWQQRFYVFSKGGEILRTFKSPLYASVNLRLTEDGILCYNMNQFANVENSYHLIDTVGKLIKSFPNKYSWNKDQGAATYVYVHENIFYRFNNKLYKKEVYCDTVYMYENMDFKPHLIIDHGKRKISPKARTEASVEEIRDNFITPINLFEFGDYIYYEFIINLGGHHEGMTFLGSKKNDFKILFDPEKDIINDIDGGPVIWPKAIKDDYTIISWIDAVKLKDLVTSETFKSTNPKYPEKKKELEKLVKNLKETDNPVLILARIKK